MDTRRTNFGKFILVICLKSSKMVFVDPLDKLKFSHHFKLQYGLALEYGFLAEIKTAVVRKVVELSDLIFGQAIQVNIST